MDLSIIYYICVDSLYNLRDSNILNILKKLIMNKNIKKVSKIFKMAFTGERLILEINKETVSYYEHLIRYLFVLKIIHDKV